jgi:hypothetical protein
VRGDTGPSNHGSGYSLAPDYSVLTDAADYNAHNIGSNPTVVSQYCNGSRVPPEAACKDANGHTIPCGYQVPPGISDATVPNPVFSLLPSATVDEGNNWINMSWGPLSLVNPSTNTVLGNYALAAGSPAIDSVPLNATTLLTNLSALAMDFFGNPRPDPANPNYFDVGAVEFAAVTPVQTVTVTPTSLTFANQVAGTTSAVQTITISNTGNATLTGGAYTFGGGTPQPFARAAGAAGGTCTATIAAGASCTYNVVFSPAAAGSFSRTLTFAASGWTVTGSPVALNGTSSAVAVAFSAPTPSLVTGTTTAHSGTVTVTNNSGAAITLASAPTVQKVGVAGGTFTIGAGGTCTSGSTVAAGGTCTIVVNYNPGGSLTTATAHVVLTDTLAGAAGTATQTGPNFTAN